MTIQILMAIAALCQVTGSSNKEGATYADARSQQLACQKMYIQCVKENKTRTTSADALTACVEAK